MPGSVASGTPCDIATTTDTFLFIPHTTDVLLFKFRCKIFIGVRIIKEMPGSVASGTPCDIAKTTDTFLFIPHTTNALLFKFRCKIFNGVRIIK